MGGAYNYAWVKSLMHNL